MYNDVYVYYMNIITIYCHPAYLNLPFPSQDVDP